MNPKLQTQMLLLYCSNIHRLKENPKITQTKLPKVRLIHEEILLV